MQDKNDIHGRRCTYFHQKFQEIVLSEDGWPFYQRKARIGPRYKWTKSVRGTEFKIDNRWTVPYNLFLHQKYQPHINGEVCSSVQPIKYRLHKYAFKGDNRMTIQLRNVKWP